MDKQSDFNVPQHARQYYDVPIPKRPRYRVEVVGKKTLLGKLGLACPGQGWEPVGFRKVGASS